MAYDSAIVTYTTKTDKVDLVQAAHMNAVQNELIAIETMLGTGIRGSCADLKTRLAVCLAETGALQKGTNFPCSAIEGQLYYRTDTDLLYIRDDSQWDTVGTPALGNVIFCWGIPKYVSKNTGFIINATSQTDVTTSAYYNFFRSFTGAGGYNEMMTTKFRKISGISTLTIYGHLWSYIDSAGYNVKLKTNINSTDCVVTSNNSITPTWYSNTMDVSGFSNDAVYDVIFYLGGENANSRCFCDGIIIFAS